MANYAFEYLSFLVVLVIIGARSSPGLTITANKSRLTFEKN